MHKQDLGFIYNNKYLDKFFLKGLMVFEHHPKIEEDSLELITEDQGRFGDMAIGSSLRFVTTDI